MKVNDGESGSSQELKPSANFCDAYLSYLSKNSVKLPAATTTTDNNTSSDATDEHGVLRVGKSNSPGSKWTFYNRSSPHSTDPKVGAAQTKRIGDRFATRESSGGRRVLTKSGDRQFIGRGQLRVHIEQLNLGNKGLSINGKRITTGRKDLSTGKAGLRLRGKQLPVAEKQLKVSVELINLNDSFVKVGGEVIKVLQDQPNTSENAKTDRAGCKPGLSHQDDEEEVDQSKDLPLNKAPTGLTPLTEISILPCLNLQPLDQTSPEGLDCAEGDAEVRRKPSSLSAISRCLSSGDNSCETINVSLASSDEKQLSSVTKDSDDFQLSLDVDKSHLIQEGSAHCLSDLSESVQVEANETCIELSDDDKSDKEVKESRDDARKADPRGCSSLGATDVRFIRSSRSTKVKLAGRLADGGERSKFSPSSLRKTYKISWRRKIVKRHLVSEKLKTQATRLLNADRPKRNVVSKKVDGASIGLSRREEVELTRALYASLQTQKQKNKPTVEGATNNDDVTEITRDGASQVLSLLERTNTYPCQSEGFFSNSNRLPSVQAQRKFASAPNHVAPVGTRKRGKRPGNILVSKKARTEDFLTFLCLRERTVVPSLLDFIHGLQNMGSQDNVIKSKSSTVSCQNNHDQHVSDHNPTFTEMHPPPRLPTPVKLLPCDETPVNEPVNEPMNKSSTEFNISDDPKCSSIHSSGINMESVNEETLIIQNSTTICESLPSSTSSALTVDLTPSPVGFQKTDNISNVDSSSPVKVHSSSSINISNVDMSSPVKVHSSSSINISNVDMSSPVKVHSSSSINISNVDMSSPVKVHSSSSINISNVDMPSPAKVHSSSSIKNLSKTATSSLGQRKLELSKSSGRRLRPSTRAVTAARADEQLMLAKQRLSPVASESEEQNEMSNASEVKVDLSEAIAHKDSLDNALDDKADLSNVLEDKAGLNRVEELMDIGSPVKALSCVDIPSGSHTSGDEGQLESGQPSMDMEPLVEMEIDDCATSSKSSSLVNGLSDCGSNDGVKKHANNPGYPDSPQRRLLRTRTGKKDLENSGSPAKKGGGHARSLRISRSCSKDSLAQEPMTASNAQGSDQLPNDKPALGCHIRRVPLSISFFPSSDDPARIVTGPSYHPSEEQFEDPIQYIELIQMNAESFGMCRVVPPDGWKVECCIPQELRFNTSIQYINRLRHRCGSNSFQMDCIKKHLDSQKIQMDQFPLLNGIQVDLVALSKAVKQCGGLQNVIDKNTWSKVAKIMHLPKYDKDKAQRLCQIYCRYLLSYDTLNEDERQKLAKQVTGRRQPNNYNPKAHCFAKGKTRTLGEFFNVARNITGLYFDQEPSTSEVEAEYFRLLGESEKHVAVHMVHIDTEQCGSAFPDRKDSPYARHGWNFNVLKKNEGSLLNNLGRIEGVTSLMLHVGMLFSTSCWTRHRHYLPFIHYLHTGADIIWYCIPASETQKFRKFVDTEILNSKDLELGSEQSQFMVSPDELVMHGISVSRVVQRHGEYVVVFPEAFTSYVCSGYSISESMYFATPEWIVHGCKAIQVLRDKSLPEMFSLTKVLFNVAFTSQPRPSVLEAAIPHLRETINAELSHRKKILQLGLNRTTVSHDEHVLCEICKTRCFLSAVVSEQDDVVLCLEHALSRLQKKKKINSYKMLYQFEEKDLKHMMQKVIEISEKSTEMG